MDPIDPPPSSRHCSQCGVMFQTELERCPRDGAPVEVRADDPLIGQVLAGRYRVLERLGTGGMGVVYRVEHQAMGKAFAVKILYGELAGDKRMAERFQREAQALSRLSHRNILAIVDFGESDRGLLFLVTELVSGRELFDEGPVLSTHQAVHVVRQVARALHHAHGNGIIHRDLKPENIMLVTEEDDPHVVKLLDFGVAHVAPRSRDDQRSQTVLGTIMGTPEYMSPEQARGQEVDGRADLYSLGVILYELLAGRRPFEASNPVELVMMHVSSPPPPLTRRGLPAGLTAVVMKLLAKSRDDRYADALEVLAALDGVVGRRTPLPEAPAAEPTPAPPLPTPTPELTRSDSTPAAPPATGLTRKRSVRSWPPTTAERVSSTASPVSMALRTRSVAP